MKVSRKLPKRQDQIGEFVKITRKCTCETIHIKANKPHLICASYPNQSKMACNTEHIGLNY